MSTLLFEIPPHPAVPVAGDTRAFPVRRIFCVGRNYVEHAKEMGFEVDREAPFYFLKSATSIVHTGATIPYAPGTANLHYEMEFVVAISGHGFRVPFEGAMELVYGYACGLDMTRRDLQISHREKGRPWDFGKDFENAAVIAPITPKSAFGAIGPQRIALSQNGVVQQDSTLAELVWSVPEIISHLSGFYHLQPGDLIYTGTPAGVGPVKPGDVLLGSIEGLAALSLTIGNAE
jgi:fumarylpyruvate hydrolase